MKKLIFIFVIAFSFIIMNANATCPTGWTSRSVTYLYDSDNDEIGDCEVTVHYCHITLPTGEFKVKIDRITLQMDCALDFIDTTDFWDDMRDRVRKDFMELVTFPPCPLAVFNVEIRRADCWAIKNVPPDLLLQTPWYMELVDCGQTGFCEWYYKICYDSNLGKNVSTYISKNSVPSESCTGTMPQLPPQGYSWNQAWTTECYGVSCGE